MSLQKSLVMLVFGAVVMGASSANPQTPATNRYNTFLAQPNVAAPSPPPAAIGDVVMSVFPLDVFRKIRGDNGPNFAWFPCDNTDLAGTPLQAVMPRTPDFRGRYPRGFAASVPDLAAGESGGPGTTVGWTVGAHGHSVTMDIESFSHGDDEHGPVWNTRPGKHTWATSTEGGKENRPNSVVLNFYIKVR